MHHHIRFITTVITFATALIGLTACGTDSVRYDNNRGAEVGSNSFFEELGGGSRVIRGAVANHYWTGEELISPQMRDRMLTITGFTNGTDEAVLGDYGKAVLPVNVQPDTLFRVYEMRKPYKDRQTKSTLGYRAYPVAIAKVVSNVQGQGELYFVSTRAPIRKGYRLLSANRAIAHVVTKRPQINISGRIIAAVGSNTTIRQQQVVTMNLGSNDGVKAGQLLGVYDPSTPVSAKSTIGELVVVRVYATLSYGLITRAPAPIPIGAKVANATATIPVSNLPLNAEPVSGESVIDEANEAGSNAVETETNAVNVEQTAPNSQPNLPAVDTAPTVQEPIQPVGNVPEDSAPVESVPVESTPAENTPAANQPEESAPEKSVDELLRELEKEEGLVRKPTDKVVEESTTIKTASLAEPELLKSSSLEPEDELLPWDSVN